VRWMPLGFGNPIRFTTPLRDDPAAFVFTLEATHQGTLAIREDMVPMPLDLGRRRKLELVPFVISRLVSIGAHHNGMREREPVSQQWLAACPFARRLAELRGLFGDRRWRLRVVDRGGVHDEGHPSVGG
jgi:hypothetical protein